MARELTVWTFYWPVHDYRLPAGATPTVMVAGSSGAEVMRAMNIGPYQWRYLQGGKVADEGLRRVALDRPGVPFWRDERDGLWHEVQPRAD